MGVQVGGVERSAALELQTGHANLGHGWGAGQKGHGRDAAKGDAPAA
jgi:hypothetical protein